MLPAGLSGLAEQVAGGREAAVGAGHRDDLPELPRQPYPPIDRVVAAQVSRDDINDAVSRIETPLEELIQFIIDHQKDIS